MNELDTLKKTLSLCIEKKEGEGTSSIAYGKNTFYASGSLASDTNSLNVTSEQAALIISSLNKDYTIHTVVTLVNTDHPSVSPVVLKILIDHSMRTGIPIKYKIINHDNKVLFETEDASLLLPFYTPERIIISR